MVASIAEALGRLSAGSASTSLALRRANRIRTLRGSLAIEGNTLGDDEIRTIMEGRVVVAPPREVQEVRNAIKVYDAYHSWSPANPKHLLAAHGMLVAGLMDKPGRYRRGGVGVMGERGVLHMAPPAKRVPLLMGDLIEWLARTDAHPLIKSAVFHYEFEFIHPFDDGNGRMGRLWQTLILSRWKAVFSNLPVESMIHARQQAYYAALKECGAAGASTAFITFILRAISDTITDTSDQVSDQVSGQVSGQVSDQVSRLLAHLRGGPQSAAELMAALGLSHRPSFRQRYLKPAIEAGLVQMTHPEAPRHKNQRYRLASRPPQ